MKANNRLLALLIMLGIVAGIFGILDVHNLRALQHRTTHVTVLVPTSTPAPNTSKQYTAALEVARIFGRSTNGCAEADPKLITTVAEESLKANVDPRILAALIAVESGCNQYAASNKGAFGLTQITARVWKDTYNFEKDYNLFNPSDNIHIGATILGGLIKTYGLSTALRRYNGLSVDSDAYDVGYTDRVQALAAKR